MKFLKTWRLLAILLLLVFATTAFTFSGAKYIDNFKDNEFLLVHHLERKVYYADGTIPGTTDGYYAFTMKGGDGGSGLYALESNTSADFWNSAPGGTGGIVSGVIKVGAGESIVFTCATAGAWPTRNGNTNTYGGNEGSLGGGSSGWRNLAYLVFIGQYRMVGGTGGGYSLLKVGGVNAAIAGGGGGTASPENITAGTYKGGDGGSMTYGAWSGTSGTDAWANGGDATGSRNGKGGSNGATGTGAGGTGGTTNYNGGNGTSLNGGNSGRSGTATGNIYGAAGGGGGWFGGGGGAVDTGTGATQYEGSGGGGSSWFNLSKVVAAPPAGVLPAGSSSGGYLAIYYLGPEYPNARTIITP